MRSTTQDKSIVTENLVLYLDAANPNSYPRSGDTWFDLSGTNNHLTLAGTTKPTYTTDYNGSMYFNGTSYAFIPSNLTLCISVPSITVVCSTQNGVAIVRGQGGGIWNYGIVGISSTGFVARQTSGDTTITGLPAATSPINIYSAIWNGSAVEFYRNGIYYGNNSDQYTVLTDNIGTLAVGAALQFGGSYSQFFTGNINVVQLYNRRLSSAEVIQNHNALKGRFGLQ